MFFMSVLIGLVIVEESICAGQRNTIVSHFCGPEGRFYCRDSVLGPVPFSYLCVRVRISGVLKIVCG